MSKFNTFWITNKDLDKEFCDVNVCNGEGAINPCEDGDFYCPLECRYAQDNDCPRPPEEPEPVEVPVEAPKEPEKPAPATLNLTTQSEPEQKTQMSTGKFAISFMDGLELKTRFWTMTVLFIISYLFGFLLFQHHHWKHG